MTIDDENGGLIIVIDLADDDDGEPDGRGPTVPVPIKDRGVVCPEDHMVFPTKMALSQH